MKTNITKMILSCLMLLCTVAMWAQERGRVTGKITLSDNSAAENISVALKGTNYGTTTNSDGTYELRNVKPGNYVIRVSAVGVTAVEENISIGNGETVTKDIMLSESQQQLGEVVIEGRGNKFGRTSSTVVSKMPLKDLENPQVYNTITGELLKEQVVTNMNDAYKNVPGLDRLWESTGRGGDGAGYFTLRGFAVQPTMINGLPAISNGSEDPQNVERIEVIKGPSGTLFGSSLISYGGLINVTTKKPYDTFGGSVSYTGGTYGLNRYTLDVNTPFKDAEKGAIRINAAYHNENSFQDAGFRKSFFVAPSIVYNATEKLSFFVNTEFYNNRSTSNSVLFVDRFSPLVAHNIAELESYGYDRNRSYTGNDLYIDTPTFNMQGQMNYKINDQWTSQTAFSRTSTKSDGYYSYLYEGTSAAQAMVTGPLEGLVFGRFFSKQSSETYGTDIQQNFIGDFKIGNFRNRLVVGLDYFNRNVVNNSSPYVGNGYVYIGNNQGQFSSFLTAVGTPGSTDDSGVLTQPGVDALLANSQISPMKTKEEIFSAYASDVFNITPSLSAMVSLRVDRFSNKGDLSTSADDFNQTAYSPKFGIVYQPILDKVSVFANYMDGFTNVAPVQDRVMGVSITRTFNPEHATQFEVGTKLNLMNNKVTATISYYDITVNDMVYATQKENTATPGLPDILNVQDGKQRNRGFEAFITANPVQGLNIVAGYSYNDSRLKEGDPDFKDRRPESAGPQNLANLWASYRFNSGFFNGFGLGFGGNYASENKIFNRNYAGTFTVPEYTILNASAFYTIEGFTLTLKMDNITDKDYYKGWSTISPQRPRTFAANLSYQF